MRSGRVLDAGLIAVGLYWLVVARRAAAGAVERSARRWHRSSGAGVGTFAVAMFRGVAVILIGAGIFGLVRG